MDLNILHEISVDLLDLDYRIQQSDVKLKTRIRVRRQLEKVNQSMQRAVSNHHSYFEL